MKNFVFFVLGMIVMLIIVLFAKNIPYIMYITETVKETISAFDNNQVGNEDEYFYDDQNAENYIPGLTLFPDGKEEVINIKNKQIRIFQCLYQNVALVKAGDFPNDIIMLLLGNEDEYFYDDQKIPILSGKTIKQVGIYKYETKNEYFKTVPAVIIE